MITMSLVDCGLRYFFLQVLFDLIKCIGSLELLRCKCCIRAPLYLTYRKNSKNWDTLNYYHDCPTNGIVGFYSAILRSKDADRITNRVDTDQTAP